MENGRVPFHEGQPLTDFFQQLQTRELTFFPGQVQQPNADDNGEKAKGDEKENPIDTFSLVASA